MSVEELKAMGKRLADHLASKHGIKLRHSAILEALAVQFGHRDWNTLAACASSGSLKGLQAGFSPKTEAVPGWSGKDSYLLGQGRSGACSMSYADMRGNLLIQGLYANDEQDLLCHLLQQQIRQGGGFIVFDNTLHSPLREFLTREWIAHRQGLPHWLNLVGERSTCSVNPLATDIPGKVAAIALAPLKLRKGGQDAFWVDYAHVVLEAVIAALRTLERPVTFKALAALFEQTDGIPELGSKLPTGLPVTVRLGEIANRLTDGDIGTCSVILMLRHALSPFATGPLGQALNGGQAEIDLDNLIENNEGLLVSVDPTRSFRHAGSNSGFDAGVILEALANLLLNRCEAPRPEQSSPPLLIVIPDAPAWVPPGLLTAMSRSGRAGVGFVLTERWNVPLVAAQLEQPSLVDMAHTHVFRRHPDLTGSSNPLAGDRPGPLPQRVLRALSGQLSGARTREDGALSGPDSNVWVARRTQLEPLVIARPRC